ncbi:MAG: hypothetical protein JW874_09330 [Spirochaetales bacterium]|nr:hypothetical protein [Spirochaetales bacterium]
MKKLVLYFAVFLSGMTVFAQNADLIVKAAVCGTEEGLSEVQRDADSLKDGYADLYTGMVLHNIGQTDPNRIDEALKRLERIWNAKKNSLALAYLGSARTIKAGRFFAEGRILEASTGLADGIRLMDEACNSDPDNRDIRVLRIVNGFALSESSPVDRYDVISDDLGFLEKQLTGLTDDMKAAYWYYRGRLALAHDEWDEAFAALEKAMAAAPGSPYAAAAEDLLWELED